MPDYKPRLRRGFPTPPKEPSYAIVWAALSVVPWFIAMMGAWGLTLELHIHQTALTLIGAAGVYLALPEDGSGSKGTRFLIAMGLVIVTAIIVGGNKEPFGCILPALIVYVVFAVATSSGLEIG